ncbi:EthD domain-containing protein [Rhodococcus opacus]|uniref:EthD domain-containing protein n=1 Tax=Rhodococcus opacus TaxID=37919 RepID=UPI001B305C05|nr:EthD domain-containing protein [Rhodococcus opacus]
MIKVLVAGKRKPGISRHAMQHHALAVHADLVKTSPGFWQHCHRYVQNHIVGGFEMVDGRLVTTENTDFDVVAEFWFDDTQDAVKAWTSDDYVNILRPDELQIADVEAPYLMLVTTEHVIGGSNPAMRGGFC